MKMFKDRHGDEWTVDLTVAAVERVRAHADVDLLDIGNQDLYVRLTTDPVVLVHVLYGVLKPQIDEKNLSAEDFADRFKGESIDDAFQAFMEEWVDFFRSPGRRRVLRKGLEKLKELEEKGNAWAMERLESGAIDKLMDRALKDYDTSLDASSTSSPESSASTPAPSP